MQPALKIYPNEVGIHTPELQLRLLQNTVTNWIGRFIPDHRRHPVAKFHLDIYDELAWGTEDVVIKVARSYAKTTLIENFICYLACEYPRLKKMENPPVFPFRKVLCASATGPKAEEIMYNISQQLEYNELIVTEYGNLEGNKWTERLKRTRDGFEFKVGGRGCQVRGFRPQLFIGDDLEDDEEVESDEQMEKTRRWLDSAVLNALDEIECRGFFLGTVLHPDSALNYLSSKPGFKTKEFMAYVDGVEAVGHELWPSKWSHERLQERKAKIGARAFNQEFLNRPMITENPIFMREWFRKYEAQSSSFMELDKKGLYTVVTCDPAISKKDKADYSAVVTLSATYGREPDIYVRVGGVRRGHWNLGRTVTEIYNAYDKFHAKKVGIETVAYQQALADEFKIYKDTHNRNVPVEEFVPDKDKERRANVVAPIAERGRVFVDSSDPMSQRLIDECVNFQPGKMNIKKDLMDAFVYGLKMLKDWSGRHENKKVNFGMQTYGV
jgi:predicted phage terminase large subunit-like protein